MFLSSVSQKNSGFTLAETLVALVIAGILAAVAVPNILGWYRRTQVNDAIQQVEGAIKEAQREAIRRSTTCTVNLPTSGTTDATITASPSGCLSTGNRTLNRVILRHNFSPATVAFTFKGNTSSGGTLVLAPADTAIVNQKCLVLAPGIGLMRVGDYANSDTTGTSAGNCTTSQ